MESCYIHDELMKQHLPQLYAHLTSINLTSSLYGAHWFLTVFIIYFPIQITVRIWDIYLLEGRKTIHRVALAIMKINAHLLI